MGSYVNDNLGKDEWIVHQGKVSIWSEMPIIVLGLCLVFAYGVGIFLLIYAYIRYSTTELAITNKRVIAKFGFISRYAIEMNLSKVESILVNQGILGRIFNFGSLSIAGAGAVQAPVPGIDKPMEFRRKAMETVELVQSGRDTGRDAGRDAGSAVRAAG